MIEIKTKAKEWGNSIGVIIPKEAVIEEGIKPNQEITLQISTKPITRGTDIFGKWKFKKSTNQLLKEVRKEFDWGF
ncbi:MAG TPA: hypothetical protein VJH95_00130 [Candidatus Nanoarchaeia archaeon]|nr:hypothetical protein [Candidatus Nanoarchaeia archaeon]